MRPSLSSMSESPRVGHADTQVNSHCDKRPARAHLDRHGPTRHRALLTLDSIQTARVRSIIDRSSILTAVNLRNKMRAHSLLKREHSGRGQQQQQQPPQMTPNTRQIVTLMHQKFRLTRSFVQAPQAVSDSGHAIKPRHAGPCRRG